MSEGTTATCLVFSNQGEIDPRLITTMGVNVKEGETAIGYFGTGLKYAIAVVLRLGGQISIRSGEREFEFALVPETIRGKEFQFLEMVEVGSQAPCWKLGFTTELGKNWHPWMAYRELWCNAVDEGGRVSVGESDPTPMPGQTDVVVRCKELLEAHYTRGDFILTSKPLWEHRDIDVHPGPGTGVFYRGILVCELPNSSRHVYNIKSRLQLTEDRTASTWQVTNLIGQAMVQCQDAQVLREALSASESMECKDMDWNWFAQQPSREFLGVMEEIIRSNGKTKLPESAVTMAARNKPELGRPEEVRITDLERVVLERAKEFCKDWLRMPITVKVFITDDLGPDVICSVYHGDIWLSMRAFEAGVKCVVGSLFEMQSMVTSRKSENSYHRWLVDRLVSLAELWKGEPL